MQLPLFGSPFRALRNEADTRASDPFLQAIWLGLRQRYFPTRPDIDDYQVLWSNRRQKRTLASCSLEQRKIRVARELSNQACVPWIEPLLYHEMCHAFLGRTAQGYHGAGFRKIEALHPLTPALDGWIKSGGWLSAVRSDRARRRRRYQPSATPRAK